MKNPDSPDPASAGVGGHCPLYFKELAQAHVRSAIVKGLAVLFTTLAIALAAILAFWPPRPSRYYVPEARAGDAAGVASEVTR